MHSRRSIMHIESPDILKKCRGGERGVIDASAVSGLTASQLCNQGFVSRHMPPDGILAKSR